MARLRGEASSADTSVARSRLLGVVSRFARDELLPFEISDEGYERIAAILRNRLAVQVSQVGRSLHAPGTFSLDRDEGGTRVRMTGDWSGLGIGVPTGAVLGMVFPGIPAIAMFVAANQSGLPLVALQAVWVLPSLVAAGAWLMRKAGAVQATRGVVQMTSVYEAVLEAAREHARPALRQVRVESEGESESESDRPTASGATPRPRPSRRLRR